MCAGLVRLEAKARRSGDWRALDKNTIYRPMEFHQTLVARAVPCQPRWSAWPRAPICGTLIRLGELLGKHRER
jgi:hypothetical protein